VRLPSRSPKTRAACAALCALAGCAVVDPDPQWAERGYAIVEASAFRPSPVFATGFDAAAAPDAFAAGDEVVFGLQLDDHGDKREWSLAVSVVDPALPDVLGPEFDWNGKKARAYERRHALLAEARVYDGEGRQLGVDRLELSRDLLTRGLVQACREATSGSGTARGEAAGYAWQSLRELMRVVRNSPVLRDILWQVISKPSLFSIIGHFGVHVRQHEHFDKARAGAPFAAGGELPTWEVPVEVTINDAPALRSIVVATEPRSPWNLCAGIVALTAVHPHDPQVTFSMRLLAARRGH
jgi:hypothetical protein